MLEEDTLVLIDAGAEFDLYAGDITRTFPVVGALMMLNGRFTEVVLDAQACGGCRYAWRYAGGHPSGRGAPCRLA